MKTYTYEQPYYALEVVITGLFCLMLAILCGGAALAHIFLPQLLLVFFSIVALYQVWNTFIAIANPEKVVIEQDALTFSAFGRSDRFARKDIHELRIREFPTAGKMYVRINGGGFFHGRYWLQTKVMSDGSELFHRMLDMEYELHPNTIKARARRVNTVYVEHEQQVRAYQDKKRSRAWGRLFASHSNSKNKE